MRIRPASARLAALLAAVALSATACEQAYVETLASDALAGRENDTPQSAQAQDLIISQLSAFADGAVAGATGDDAFRQPFDRNGVRGTNILAVIPGTDLADEYVLVGGHYDHVATCDFEQAGDTICNGATDNAAGASAVVEIGRRIAESGEQPRRSIVLALWDAEEDGLVGAKHYAANPVVPLADTVAYLNFDILGGNLLPSLRNVSTASGAETGGFELRAALAAASQASGLSIAPLSNLFGLERSDHVPLRNAGVPIVFFSDATTPCYHTNEDEADIVDFGKLAKQVKAGRDLTVSLANADTRPTFTPPAPTMTYDDAVSLRAVLSTISSGDRYRYFSSSERSNIRYAEYYLNRYVDAGPSRFNAATATQQVVPRIQAMLDDINELPCDGFLAS